MPAITESTSTSTSATSAAGSAAIYCNARNSTRDPSLASIPPRKVGPWAGTGYCRRVAGYGTGHLGEGRCKSHGGLSLRGIASPQFETGKYSRFIPARYKVVYDRALDDPLAQREQKVQLALMDAMQDELLRRFDTGESGGAWSRVQEAANECKAALRNAQLAQDAANMDAWSVHIGEAVKTLEHNLIPAIDHGAGEEEARKELVDLFGKRAKLLKVQQGSERTVPVEVLGIMLTRTAAIMAELITDRRLLSLMITRLRSETLPVVGTGLNRTDEKVVRNEISESKDIDV